MAFLDKLMFWKKKDELAELGLKGDKELGLGNLGLDTEIGGMGSSDIGMGAGMQMPAPEPMQQQMQFPRPLYPSFQQPAYQQPQSQQDYVNSKNLEVISSKLDAIRSAIDSISQRLANLEAMARGEQEDKRRRYY